MGSEEKKYFGLKFWLITIFGFPISLVYVVIKIIKYQGQYSHKSLYYNELYKKQKFENEKEMYIEGKAEEKALEKLIEILESKKDKNQPPEE